jgi:hypothetical protein
MSDVLRTLMAATAVIILAGCGAGRQGGPAAGGEPYPPPQHLYSDNGGGIQDSLRIVIHDEAELRGRWSDATSAELSPPALPTVDFGRQMVVLVAAGRLTTDDQILVDSATTARAMDPAGRMQQTLTIHVRTVHGCRPGAREAYPLQLVRMQRFNGPVRFSERVERADNCRDEDPE